MSRIPARIEEERQEWIAIEPPSPRIRQASGGSQSRDDLPPPSFIEAQFDIVLRRQRMRPRDGGGRKLNALPSRFLNLTNDFEFAGWGTLQNLSLEKDDIVKGEERQEDLARSRVLGQFTASALAGNDVLGSVFYALPAVVGVAGVYSPISLFVASLVLFLWRPVMEELASALPISGAPYTYILNVSTKSFALVSAALLLLDFVATSVISAATAASYLAGEVTLPFPTFVAAILVLLLFTAIGLMGMKESARIALIVLVFHFATMIALMLVAIAYWGRIGNSQLAENWVHFQAPSPASALRQIFYGVCLGMLSVTGFECTPSYVARITPGNFPKVLRNLHLPTILLNVLVMLVVLAILPVRTILGGANVLSILAEKSAGHWMRIWVVVDAITVLCGGVLTGLLSACELFEQLSHDRVIPTWFLKTIPRTGAPYISIFTFILMSGLLYASAGANLLVVSQMFSLVWLTVMTLFPVSLLLLKYNRGRLQGSKRVPIWITFASICIAACTFAGNIVIAPSTTGYFAAYFIGIVTLFTLAQRKLHLLHWVYWLYDQFPSLHQRHFSKSWGSRLINYMTILRKQPVCILVNSDEIHHLFRMVLYVQNNEETSCLKIIHFNDTEEGVPSELEANSKILDEAFPEITIDLIIVRDTFEPTKVAALAHRLNIPTSLMFMGCPGGGSPHSIADFGTRIISL